jgi:predicted amidohydrolase
MHGFHRVRESCRARAIENQVFVVHASLVGSLGREPVPSTAGSSAILAPCVEPFPADGVLAETRLNAEEIAVAELDFEALVASRESGDVRNWHDRSRGDWTPHDPS